MKKKLISYFGRRGKEIEKERSKRLAETGFILGALIVADEDSSDSEIILGGLAGLFAAAVFEVVYPKASNFVKRIL